MQKRRTWKGVKQMLRRFTALGMAAAGIWMLLLTVRLPQPEGVGGQAAIAVLNDQLAQWSGASGSFWTQLLEWKSPYLAIGQGTYALETPSAADSETQEQEEGESAAEEPAAEEPSTQEEPSGQVPGTAEPVELPTSSSQVSFKNATELEVDVAALCAAPVNITLGSGEKPQILILHTHATEAYTQDGEDRYEPSDDYRTTDTNYNMVRVGDEITQVLEEAGFSVLHDTTLYDYPDYTKAYTNAYTGIVHWLEEYPSIRIVIDVHRDALESSDGTIYKTMAEVNGEKSAQVMLVMGSNGGGKTFDDWQENLTLALHLQQQMDTNCPGLARPVTLRTARYNEQLTTGSMLVEIGSHGNTLQEALIAARLFALSAAQVFEGLKE